MRSQWTKLAALSAVALISGCSGLQEKISDGFAGSDARASSLVKDVGGTRPAEQAPAPVVHESGMWVAKKVLKLEPEDMLPAIFKAPTTFDRTVYSLSELAERITLRSGIPTKVTPDAQEAALRTTYPGYANAGFGGGMPNVPLAPPPGSAPQPVGSRLAPSLATQGQYATQSMPVHIVYPDGTLKGLLDTASARFGVFWKYTNATIQFYYTDTRTFQINAVPGDSALSASVASGSTSGTNGGTGSGSGTGGGGSDAQGTLSANNTQNTAVNSQLSVFGSIEKAVSAMLTPYGKVVASPATGTITVVDTPDTLDRVAQLIKAENSTLTRQVMVNVTVLSVTRTDGDNLGINWNLVYSDLLHKYGIQNTLTAQPNSNSFSAGILNTANSRWSGSSLVINALASQGKVRRETTASVVTLNNQPVPVQVATETSYLRSSQTTITANVGSTTTLDPGTVTSGFNMTILPHVLDNGTVMLQFSTDMSSLRQIRTVTSDNSTIETPELDTRNFLQRVAMKSNETLIISGFEQTDDNLQRQGTGNAHNWLFGGGYNAQSSKEVIVILITPVTMPSA